MILNRWLTLLFPPVVLLLVACGGSGDSSDNSFRGPGSSANGNSANGNSSSGNSSSASGSGSQKGKNAGVVTGVKDGAFQKGSMTVEITGDKRSNTTMEGGGFAQSGAVLLSFGKNDGGAFLTFVPVEGDDSGGISISFKDLATAGAWGEACEVTVKTEDDKISGDFKCDKIDAVVPGEAKAFRITVKGKFSAER